MLSVLRINNLAVVDSLEIEFHSALNVITGETGAGKSVILKALELIMGRKSGRGASSKSGTDFIRDGAERCEIEALFVVPAKTVETLAEALPEEFEEGELERDAEDNSIELIVRRVIDRGGRSKNYLNGRLIPRGQLDVVMPYLLEITSQFDQQLLFDPSRQRDMLDSSGVSSALLESVETAYSAYQDVERLYNQVTRDRSAREERLRVLQLEREELETASLRPGEREELLEESRRLSSSESLESEIRVALSALEEGGGGESGIADQLRVVRAKLSASLRVDSSIKAAAELLENAEAQVAETQSWLARYLRDLRRDPERLTYLRDRLAEVARLERKYGRSSAELVQYLAEISEELDRSENGEMDEAKLAVRLAEKEKTLREAEGALTKARKSAAKSLAKKMEEGLAELGMKHARFRVDLHAANSGPTGADQVEFYFTANPGVDLKPLSGTASGGELSRVLLVLKALLSAGANPLLQVFDEVDVGVGGAIAQIVGEKLLEISKKGQVLLVTHAPQIAALADAHILVRKEVVKGRTKVVTHPLSQSERVGEVARMLAGKNISGNFENSARELLKIRKRAPSATHVT